ncbi:MAG: hypothetical protein RL477_1317 [Pseudomonadota bacterium]|jgi:lipid A 4'-phosphatase
MKPFYFLVVSLAAAAAFAFFPEIDLRAARLLADPGQKFQFPLREWPPVALLHDYVPFITWGIGAGLVFAALALAPGVPARFRARPVVLAYVALSLAIGPGLITNSLLKEYSGRARPAQVTEFGGPKQFTPAFFPARQCETNCSFVSGHAATGFFLVTFAFLMAPGARRRAAMAGALAAGTVFGLARMAEGGHWLSDVVFSGVINVAVAWILYSWMIGRRSG